MVRRISATHRLHLSRTAIRLASAGFRQYPLRPVLRSHKNSNDCTDFACCEGVERLVFESKSNNKKDFPGREVRLEATPKFQAGGFGAQRHGKEPVRASGGMEGWTPLIG
jgi:hypothetical protein